MADLTLRDVMAHRTVVPWPNMRQVEQDLLLCRSMDALFKDDFLSSQVSMRGGTLLHKVHLAPASRYSEDIDLVVHGDRPETHIRKAINRVLKDILGEPANSTWEDVKLAVRNVVRPSRILRLIYRVPSVSGGDPLEGSGVRNTYRPPEKPKINRSYPFSPMPVVTGLQQRHQP